MRRLVIFLIGILSLRIACAAWRFQMRGPFFIPAHRSAGRATYLSAAAFGNVARKYLPGIDATQLATYRDATGANWSLVLVTRQEDPRAFYTALPVNLGWIKQ